MGSPRIENPGYAYYSLARTKPLDSVVRLAADCDECVSSMADDKTREELSQKLSRFVHSRVK